MNARVVTTGYFFPGRLHVLLKKGSKRRLDTHVAKSRDSYASVSWLLLFYSNLVFSLGQRFLCVTFILRAKKLVILFRATLSHWYRFGHGCGPVTRLDRDARLVTQRHWRTLARDALLVQLTTLKSLPHFPSTLLPYGTRVCLSWLLKRHTDWKKS